MGQVKFFGLRETLGNRKIVISDVVHDSLVRIFKLPADKKFHRFILLEKGDFIYPEDRTENYIIIEISIFEGRSGDTIKTLLKDLIVSLSSKLAIAANDIEITIFETPKANWGIRGTTGDELALPYKVEV